MKTKTAKSVLQDLRRIKKENTLFSNGLMVRNFAVDVLKYMDKLAVTLRNQEEI